MNSRRLFIAQTSIAGLGLVVGPIAWAQAVMVSESDPMAKQLNFVTDAAKVKKANAPTFRPGQKCGTCQLFQGGGGSAEGPCAIFSGKQVPAAGWCSAFVKKA